MSSPKRQNKISGQYSARLIEMLKSPAYRVLSRSAHLVISRIEVELAHHGGNDNGRLPVTTDQFVEFGMDRASVAPAIREAAALGFIRITERGRAGNAEHGAPNRFFLTFAHGRNSRQEPPTHDWRRIKTIEEAKESARMARDEKNPSAVSHGKRSWDKRLAKINPSTGFSAASVGKTHTETPKVPVRKTHTTLRGKTHTTSISREDVSEARTERPDCPTAADDCSVIDLASRQPKREWSTPTIVKIAWTDELRALAA